MTATEPARSELLRQIAEAMRRHLHGEDAARAMQFLEVYTAGMSASSLGERPPE